MRLTKRDTCGTAYAVGDNTKIDKPFANENRKFPSPAIVRGNVVDKLAEYEDVCDDPAKINPFGNNFIDSESIRCPYCDSDDTVVYSINEIQFNEDGTGHYYTGVKCLRCEKRFRKHYDFHYSVKNEW